MVSIWRKEKLFRTEVKFPFHINLSSVLALHLTTFSSYLRASDSYLKNADGNTPETLWWKWNHVYQLWKVSVDETVDQLGIGDPGSHLLKHSGKLGQDLLSQVHICLMTRQSQSTPCRYTGGRSVHSHRNSVPSSFLITCQTGNYLSIHHYSQGKQIVVCPNISKMK